VGALIAISGVISGRTPGFIFMESIHPCSEYTFITKKHDNFREIQEFKK
jgi:hypothetical protein